MEVSLAITFSIAHPLCESELLSDQEFFKTNFSSSEIELIRKHLGLRVTQISSVIEIYRKFLTSFSFISNIIRKAPVIIFLGVAIMIFLRRPDSLLNAQPWAEDGKIFIQQAIYYHFWSLLIPYSGYLHTLPRLVTLLSLSFGLVNAPFLMNLSSLLLSAFSISYLARKQFGVIVGNDLHRYLLCGLVACLPVPEIFLNITNIHWFLSFWLILWVTDRWLNYGSLQRRNPTMLVESAVAVLAFLSSPTAVLLLPILALVSLRSARDFGVFSANFSSLLAPMASSTAMLMYMFSLLSLNTGHLVSFVALPILVREFFALRFWPAYVALGAFSLLFLCVMLKKRDIVALWFGGLMALELVLVGILRPFSELIRTMYVWVSLIWFVGGIRYVFHSMALFMTLLVRQLTTIHNKKVKGLLCLFLIIVGINLGLHYELPAFADLKFKSYAREFDAQGGWDLYVPINPQPVWYMMIPFSPVLSAARLRTLDVIHGGLGGVDTVDSSVVQHGVISIARSGKFFVVVTGWGVDARAGKVARDVYLVLDDQFAFPTAYGISRPDVAMSLGNQAYDDSGWLTTITINGLTTGTHEVSLWIISSDGSICYQLNDMMVLTINRG